MTGESPSGGRGSTLLLLTGSYPYRSAYEDSFIEPQLPHLCAVFQRVILIPSTCRGERADLPSTVEVWDGFGRFLDSALSRPVVVARSLASHLLWRDLAARPSLIRSMRAVGSLVRVSGQAVLLSRWLERRLTDRRIPFSGVVGYSFWCESAAAALCLLKQKVPDIVAVSRANGIDLYLERHRPNYLPLREFTFRRLDRLFTASEHGQRYVAGRYPWFADRCEVARLGVPDPGYLAEGSRGERVSIISCSGIVPVKRVHLIAAAIGAAARTRPSVEFEWHHFGDGELRAAVEHEAHATFPANATATFHGQVAVSDVMDFYRTHPVDVFVNASESEGGSPVAIMEAASCGIPIVATAVGGNPEIVSARNGVLTARAPTPEVLGSALLEVVDRGRGHTQLRLESRRIWAERFQASSNFANFAMRLRTLRKTVALPPEDSIDSNRRSWDGQPRLRP